MAFCWSAPARADTVDRIVAVVNDEVITEADVTSQVTALLQDQEAQPPAGQGPAGMHLVMLRRLIEQRLILQEAKRAGISVEPGEVADRLETLRGRFASEEEFRRSLVDSGLSEERLKEQIRDQLLVERLINTKIRSAIVVSPQEVARELGDHQELSKPGDRVRVSHILIRVAEARSEEQARALIEDLRRRLVQGEDFSALAKRYSEDPYAEEGGAMEWVAQGELLPELDGALFNLKAGELSGPIQTRLGFHLVRVEERRSASSLSVTEANRTVFKRLYQQKFQDRFGRWIGELKRRAYIEILLPEKG